MILHRVSAECLELEIPQGDPELWRIAAIVGVDYQSMESAFVTISFKGVDEHATYTKFLEDTRERSRDAASQQDLF